MPSLMKTPVSVLYQEASWNPIFDSTGLPKPATIGRSIKANAAFRV
jgi:hypothetical protein